jgi:colicin import membrane protein
MSELAEVKDYGIGKEKEAELTIGLNIVKSERKLLIDEFNEVSKLEVTEENLPKFRNLRLKISKNRTQGINKWHKKTKDFFLTGGKFVDAIKNKENSINEEMESKLIDAENHFENLEKERIESLRLERAELLSKYVDDAYDRVLTNMEEDVWLMYLASKKKIHIDSVKAELQAEKERQRLIEEEKAEIERINLENAKLLEEANQRAKIAEEKTAKQFAAQKKIDDKRIAEEKLAEIHRVAKQKKIDADNLAKQKVIDDKRIAEQKVFDAKIAKEKIESDIIRKELQAKKQEELDLIESKKLALQNELKKGDVEKVIDLIKSLESIKTQFTFESEANIKMFKDVNGLLDKVIVFIEK